MTTVRQPRIRIEDLPALEQLSEEEAARVLGAGRFRPSFEALEDRQLLSATLLQATPPVWQFTDSSGVKVQYTLQGDGQVLQNQGSGPVVIDHGVQALAGATASNGRDALFELMNSGQLIELNQGARSAVAPGSTFESLVANLDGTGHPTSGEAYALDRNSLLSRLDATNGSLIPLSYGFVSEVSAHGKLFGLGNRGNVFSYSPTESFREILPVGSTTQMVEAGGEVYALGTNGLLSRLDATNGSLIPLSYGFVSEVSAHGKLFGLGNRGNVFSYSPTESFREILPVGSTTQMVEAGGEVYALGTNGLLSRLDAASGSWTALSYGFVSVASAHGKVFGLGNRGNLWSYTPAGGFQMLLPGGVTQLTEASGEIYALASGVTTAVPSATVQTVPGGGTLTPAANSWQVVPGLSSTLTLDSAKAVDLRATVNIDTGGYGGYCYLALFIDGSNVATEQKTLAANQWQPMTLGHTLSLSAGSHLVEVRAAFPASAVTAAFDTSPGYTFLDITQQNNFPLPILGAGNWQLIPMHNADGTPGFVASNRNGTLLGWDGTTFQSLVGVTSWVPCQWNGWNTVAARTPGGDVYTWSGSGWYDLHTSGNADLVATNYAGQAGFVTYNARGQLLGWDGQTFQFLTAPTTTWVPCQWNGWNTVAQRTADGSFSLWTGSTWSPQSSSISDLIATNYAGQAGFVTIQNGNTLLGWDGHTFQTLGAVSSWVPCQWNGWNTVAARTADGNISLWTGSAWSYQSSSAGDLVATNYAGQASFVALQNGHTLLGWDGKTFQALGAVTSWVPCQWNGWNAVAARTADGNISLWTGSAWSYQSSSAGDLVATNYAGQASFVTIQNGTTVLAWDGHTFQNLGTSPVTAADGSVWFLGTATVDGAGNYAIYRLSNGQITQVPGSATQLSSNGGTVRALTGAGKLSVATPQGLKVVLDSAQTQIAGFSVAGESLTLTSNGISFDLYVPDVGRVQFTGSYDPSTGQWLLEGTYPSVWIGYVELTDIHLKLTNSGMTLDCKVSAFGIPQLANANCHGQIYADGRFISTVDGHALQVGGFTLSNTTINLSNDNPSHLLQVSVHGNLGFLGLNSSVEGYLDAQGTFELKSSADLNVAGYRISNSTFTLNNNTGLTASGWLQVPGMGSVAVSGSISSGGAFSLTGSGDLYPLGFHLASAAVTLNNSGLSVSGSLQVPNLGSVNVSGSVGSDGQFSLTGSGDLSVFGLALGYAGVTLNNSGLGVSSSVGITNLGSVSVSGSVSSDGTFSLSGSNDLGSVTINNSGVSVSGPSLPVPQPVQNTPLDPNTWSPKNW